MQEWARAENAYADRHGPQEELLTTEDLAGLNQLEDDNPTKQDLSRLSTESITGLPSMQNRVRAVQGAADHVPRSTCLLCCAPGPQVLSMRPWNLACR